MAKFKIIDNECTPSCTLSFDQSPAISNVRLGMSLDELKKIHPTVEISKSESKKYNYAWASILDLKQDLYSVYVTFVDNKIIEIRAKFKSIEQLRKTTNFPKKPPKNLA